MKLRRFLPVALLAAIDLVILAMAPDTGQTVFRLTGSRLLEMASILPPVFLLLGLLDVWVPRETVIRLLGTASTWRGTLLSLLLGAAAAGPLYAAFPIAAVMSKKGASYRNILIFIGAWSTLKLPLVLFELANLRSAFALTRMAINVPAIVLMATLIDRLVTPAERELPSLEAND